MSTIILKLEEWRNIKEKIAERHGKSILLISWRLRRELGFTIRVHTEDVRKSPPNEEFPLYCRQETIRLDFYDDSAETMFRLTYL